MRQHINESKTITTGIKEEMVVDIPAKQVSVIRWIDAVTFESDDEEWKSKYNNLREKFSKMYNIGKELHLEHLNSKLSNNSFLKEKKKIKEEYDLYSKVLGGATSFLGNRFVEEQDLAKSMIGKEDWSEYRDVFVNECCEYVITQAAFVASCADRYDSLVYGGDIGSCITKCAEDINKNFKFYNSLKEESYLNKGMSYVHKDPFKEKSVIVPISVPATGCPGHVYDSNEAMQKIAEIVHGAKDYTLVIFDAPHVGTELTSYMLTGKKMSAQGNVLSEARISDINASMKENRASFLKSAREYSLKISKEHGETWRIKHFDNMRNMLNGTHKMESFKPIFKEISAFSLEIFQKQAIEFFKKAVKELGLQCDHEVDVMHVVNMLQLAVDVVPSSEINCNNGEDKSTPIDEKSPRIELSSALVIG